MYYTEKPRLLFIRDNGIPLEEEDFPAWSLHRLWELLDKIKKYEGEDELSYPRISLVEEDVIVENPKSLWVRQSFISPKGVYENIRILKEETVKEMEAVQWELKEGDVITDPTYHKKGLQMILTRSI